MCYIGGLGFSLHEIGTVLAISGFFQFPMNLFGFAIVRIHMKYLICVVYDNYVGQVNKDCLKGHLFKYMYVYAYAKIEDLVPEFHIK